MLGVFKQLSAILSNKQILTLLLSITEVNTSYVMPDADFPSVLTCHHGIQGSQPSNIQSPFP